MTHHPRPDIEMEGGTIFKFVEGTPAEVLQLARDAAGDKDVQLSGGVGALRDFLRAGLIDEAHIAITPILLGKGERLWDGLENLFETYELTESIGDGNITHLRLSKRTS